MQQLIEIQSTTREKTENKKLEEQEIGNRKALQIAKRCVAMDDDAENQLPYQLLP